MLRSGLARTLLAPAVLALAAQGCLKASSGQGQGTNSSAAGNSSVGNAGSSASSGGNSSVGNGGSTSGGGSAGNGVVIIGNGGSAGSGTVMKMACGDSPNQQGALPYTSGYSISDTAKTQAQTAVNGMSVTQKAAQLRGTMTGGYTDIFRTPDDTQASVKGFQFSDGPRGVNLDAVKPSGAQGYSTVFPAASLRGATFDVDLENKIGAAMGDELIAAGRTMLLAPTVNILRNPAWGRSEETYGEDSFQLGRMGSAFVQGVQQYAPACVKHYAANNIEKNRANDIAQMDEQTLQEVYARHYGMIVKDGGVSCVMAAYNLIQAPASAQAVNCTQSKHLLTDILRTEFGFQGMVLTDWWAMPGGQTPSSQQESSSSAQAILAGLDMELPWDLNFSTLEVITGGAIQQTDLTQAVQHVMNEKFRFNVAKTSGAIGLKAPTSTFDSGSYSIGNSADHIALAQQSAQEGMVLLKNDNNTLPIPGTAKTVAVVGLKVAWTLQGVSASGTVDFPKDARIGDLGSSRVNLDPSKAVGPYDGVKAAAPAGVNVVMDDSGGTSVASSADFVVVVAGLTPEDEGEEYTITPEDSDRDASLALDGKHGGTTQNNYIKSILALGKPTVVVLEGGSVIDLSSFGASAPAIVMAWYPGQSGGAALGSLLFGKANFSGKLPVSWPNALTDEPPFSGGGSTTQMGYYIGYRWFDNQKKMPAYAFGHGLSYSALTYSNLQVPCTTVTPGGVVNVTVDVQNTGMMDADETVFAFVSWPSSTVPTRAGGYKELKGFTRAHVPAGMTARVPVPIRVSDLNYWDTASSSWKIESGPVEVMVGPSSDKLTLMDTFTVQ
ncbi:MAG TPA: glycoside hydrolase family 3 C-terminal domain-containing protein [Polyangiaceae bacterium]|jgi:beta-glucosidase